MIICTKCKVEQNTICFNKDKKKKNGLKSYCKNCQKNYDILRQLKDPEGQKQRARLYRETLKKENPAKLFIHNRKTKLKRDYNLSLEQYEDMLNDQNGVCYICNQPPNKKLLAVDHCHTTNKVRKLLCLKCNTALGLVNDDITVLNNMIKYLKDSL